MKLIKVKKTVRKKDAMSEPAPIKFDINVELANLIKETSKAYDQCVEWMRFLKQTPQEIGMDPKDYNTMKQNVEKVWTSLNSVKNLLSQAAVSAGNATKRLM